MFSYRWTQPRRHWSLLLVNAPSSTAVRISIDRVRIPLDGDTSSFLRKGLCVLYLWYLTKHYTARLPFQLTSAVVMNFVRVRALLFDWRIFVVLYTCISSTFSLIYAFSLSVVFPALLVFLRLTVLPIWNVLRLVENIISQKQVQ